MLDRRPELSAGYLGEDVVHEVSFVRRRRARRSPSSGPTGPGRRRCSGRCAGCSARSRGTVTFDGRDDHRLAGPRHRPARPRLRPGRAAPVPGDDGEREPRRSARTPSDRTARAQRSCSICSPAGRAAPPARRHDERRRAADARRRSGADGRPGAPDARRADDRSRPEARRPRRTPRWPAAAKHGLTIVVAEQQVPLALGLADRAYVLENGRIQLEGTSAELAGNPDVQRAYLGIA